jgi:hypothetical protein
VAGDDNTVVGRLHMSPVGPLEFLRTMAMPLEIRKVGKKV